VEATAAPFAVTKATVVIGSFMLVIHSPEMTWTVVIYGHRHLFTATKRRLRAPAVQTCVLLVNRPY
jgi:predicted phosphodiesterase